MADTQTTIVISYTDKCQSCHLLSLSHGKWGLGVPICSSRQNNTSRQTGACDIDRYNMAATQRTLHSAMSGIASSSVLYKTKAGAVDIPIYSDGQHLQFSFDKDLTLRGLGFKSVSEPELAS